MVISYLSLCPKNLVVDVKWLSDEEINDKIKWFKKGKVSSLHNFWFPWIVDDCTAKSHKYKTSLPLSNIEKQNETEVKYFGYAILLGQDFLSTFYYLKN